MKHRTLAVEDDPDIAESIIDTLRSLGHECEWVRSQEEARQKVAAGGFTCVLLDLQIPVSTGRGLPCIEYGEQLVREIHQSQAKGVPIIVTTAYGKEGLEIAAGLCEHGVVDFVNKPFPRTGRTLASVIRAVLEGSDRQRERHGGRPVRPEKPFKGGHLVYYPDRVELCGVTVLSNGKSCQMRIILEALQQRLGDCRYKAFSGNALASFVKRRGGQGSIAGSVRDFRRNVAEALGRELGLKVEQQDVIQSGSSGYRLHPWIVVKDLRNTGTGIPGDERSAASRAPAHTDASDPANQRRHLLLAEIEKGERLRAPALAARVHCSTSTIKRELEALRNAGEIAFVGPSKTGYYVIATASR
jgi:DNA-binding response OmpR family regulator